MFARRTKYRAGLRRDKSGLHVDVLADDVAEVMRFVSGCSSAQISPTHWRLTLPRGVDMSDAKAILRRFDELSRQGV